MHARSPAGALTCTLAGILGVDAWRPDVDALFAALDPDRVEWSMNSARDPRGALRVACWLREPGRAATGHGSAGGSDSRHGRMLRACASLEQGFAHRLCGGFAGVSDDQGLGLAMSAHARTYRWWALARLYEGTALASVARERMADLDADIALLADLAGGSQHVRAVAAEGLGDMVLRHSVYVSLARPQVAVRMLEHMRTPVTRAGNLFFKALLGLEPGRDRPWPVVWISRSVGASSGWKFYYFADRDVHRASDHALLDLMDLMDQLDTPVYRAYQAVIDACGASPGRPVIKYVGLTMRDTAPDADPTFTVYMAPP